jgi:perosamine synthetase
VDAAGTLETGTTMLRIAEPVITSEDRRAVEDVLAAGWASGYAPVVGEFERSFANWCGSEHGVATGSGSAALRLALASLGIGPGDEVVIPSFTMMAVHHAVAQLGARPVLADAQPETGNVDPEAVADAIGPHTAAIVAVHTYGLPCDMDALARVAHRGGLALVEDAAEAHGATFRGLPAGSLADVAAFSFFANKIITCGEGGMVVTGDASIAENARRIADLGRIPGVAYRYECVGFNDRMPATSAALGLSQLARIGRLTEARHRNAALYREGLIDVPGLTLPPTPRDRSGSDWMFAVRVDDGFGEDRDTLAARLAQAGVETRPFFTPVHRQPFWEGGTDYPVADALAECGLLLPSGAQVRKQDVARVAGLVRAGSAVARAAERGAGA